MSEALTTMTVDGLTWYSEDDWRALVNRVEATEAKLAKAVEALGDIVKDCEADYPPSHGAIRYFARATLAELTRSKDRAGQD